MGAYLSEPILEKHSTDENGEFLSFGASSMQGWRVSQEVSFCGYYSWTDPRLCNPLNHGILQKKYYGAHGNSKYMSCTKRMSSASLLACFLVLKFYRKQNEMNQEIR
jgi:hypothetical protein